jgi:hypothetical protein
MMPVVRINDSTFADLSTLKTWFKTKSPSETIDHIVREAMEQLGLERGDGAESEIYQSSEGSMLFDTAPSLTFTKPLTASIGRTEIQNPNWASILHTMLLQIKSKGFEGEKLVRELSIPTKSEIYEEEGYTYRSDLGISVQGQSAADSWKEVDRLAEKWRIPVVVKFMWRQKLKAQYPGKNGELRSGNV